MIFFETSAKENTNVNEAFAEITTVVKHKMDDEGKSGFSKFVSDGGFSQSNPLKLSVHANEKMENVHEHLSPSMLHRGGRTKAEAKEAKKKNSKGCC